MILGDIKETLFIISKLKEIKENLKRFSLYPKKGMSNYLGGNEIVVSYDTLFIKNNIALYTKFKGAISYMVSRYGNNNTYYIVLPDKEDYIWWPDVVKSFVFYHEIGHIKNGHLDTMVTNGITTRNGFLNRSKLLYQGKVDKDEIEADAYAASVIGNKASIEALQWVKTQLIGGSSKREIELRIKALS